MALLIALSSLCTYAGAQEDAAQLADPVSTDAIESILEAFDQHTIVALGEGHHGNLQGATFRLALLRDPRFADKVDDIVVEFGTGHYQAVMDRYVGGELVPMDSLQLCWRETTQPFIWDSPIYAEFFAAVRSLNSTLPDEKKLRVLLADSYIDWSQIKTRTELEKWYLDNMIERDWTKANARDGYAVNVVEKEVFAKGRKALAIFGDAHFSRPEEVLGEGFFADYLRGNFVQQIERLHPGSVFNITTMTRPGDTDILTRFPGALSWGRPSLVVLENTKLGAWVNRRVSRRTFEEAFDALLWLGPQELITYDQKLPEAVADEEYYNEVLRRDSLWTGQYQELLPRLREEYLRLREVAQRPTVR